MKKSNILWTNYSINFWSGCKKVSPGCANCYAEAFSKRNPKTFGQWGAGAPRNWHGPNTRSTLLSLNKAAQKLGTRYKIFPNSMSDWLDDEVPIEWLAHMLETIYMTPHLTYQCVTKRPENFSQRIQSTIEHLKKYEPSTKRAICPDSSEIGRIGDRCTREDLASKEAHSGSLDRQNQNHSMQESEGRVPQQTGISTGLSNEGQNQDRSCGAPIGMGVFTTDQFHRG